MGKISKKIGGLKAVVLLSVFIAVTGIAIGLSNPSYDRAVSSGQSINLTVESQSGQNIQLKLKPPKSPAKTFSMDSSNRTYWKNIPESNFPEKGRYGYKFVTDSEEFPENSYFGITVSSLNETLKNKTLNASSTQHTNTNGGNYCAYKTEGDFSCEYENFQAYMILSSAVQHYVNGTNRTEEKFYNFTLGTYGESLAFPTCEVAGDGYVDCKNKTGQNPLGIQSGTRQGSLIHALWKSYDLVGNSSVKVLAINYTRGSAESCDVWGVRWNKSFQCDTARGQGSMALGYWTAYEQTGNETYRKFASKLTAVSDINTTVNQTDYSNPRIISAFLKGYSLTSNKSYLAEAENRTEKWLETCPNCSAQEFMGLKNALWRGYRVTGDFGYYRNAVNLTGYNSSNFCSWNSSACSYPNIQGLSTTSYWRAYISQKDGVVKKLFNPQVDPETVVGKNLSIDVEMQGKIAHPELLYRESGANKSWNNCKMSFFDGCVISGQNITKQKPYSFRFELKDNSTFPINGSFVFSPSLKKDSLVEEARTFTSSDPERFCGPNQGDFTCEGEFMQSQMISGFSSSYIFNRTEGMLSDLEKLISPPYVSQDRYQVLCKERNGYMSCSAGGNGDIYEGSVRQGDMIKSLFNSYQITRNDSYYETAINYTLGGAEDCDVWGRNYSKSFKCSSSQGQSAMINGYLEAYKVTGNTTFRNIAFNLTREAENISYSQQLGAALWRSSSYFNESVLNYSVTKEAENITETYQNYCNENCSPSQYISNVEMFQNTYFYSDANYSTQYRSAVLNTTAEGSCGPFKADKTCSSPADQGGMIGLFWDAAYSMPVELKVEDFFYVSKSTLTVGDQVQTTCSVENRLNGTNITGLNFDIDTTPGLEVSSNNTSYSAGTLEYNETESYSWNLTAESAELGNISCVLDSDTAYRNTILEDITIEEKEKQEEDEEDSKEDDSSDTGGSSSGGSFDGYTPVEDEVENKTINYNNASTEFIWNRTMIAELGINTTYRNFSYNRSCFNATRELYENRSVLNVDYSCAADEIVLIDQLYENISSLNSSEVSGFAVKYSDNLSARNISIEYNKRGNASKFKAPLVLGAEYSVPPLEAEFTWDSNLTLENSTLRLGAELNRPTNCNVYQNDVKIFSGRTTSLDEKIKLLEGNNSVNVTCGDISESRKLLVQEEEEQNIPIVPAFATLLFLMSISAVYYRQDIYSELSQMRFDYHMKKFEEAMERSDQATAIQVYSKISEIRDENVGEIILNSDLDLMRGLRVYMILDLLQDDELVDSEMSIGDDVESLVNRFLENNEDEKLDRMIREKLKEVANQ